MQRPYVFRFDKTVLERVDHLPPWSRYTFATAHQRSYKSFDGSEYTSQRLHLPHFHAELFEIRTDTRAPVHYEITEKQYFFLFMLEGSADITTAEGFYVAALRGRSLSVLYNQRGRYTIQLPPGRHTLLCIAMDAEWLGFSAQDQPALHDFLIQTAAKAHDHLPYCTMDRQLVRWLTALYTEFREGRGALDGQLRYYLSLILARYHQLIVPRLISLPWKTKDYLDLHFQNSRLSVQGVAEHLAISERTLRRQFKTEFRITVHHYYTCKRLALAHRLMQERQCTLSQVYHECGYAEERTCRYEMMKFKLR